MDIADLQRFPHLRNQWVALDPRGRRGLHFLKDGCAVVDFDNDVGDLCARLERSGLRSLEIRFFPAPTSKAA